MPDENAAEPENDDAACADQESLSTYPHTYAVADSEAVIAGAVGRALDSGTVGIALDADGDDAMTARLRGVAIAASSGEAVYVPIDVDGERRLALLSPLFAGKSILCSADVKRDMLLLRNVGVEFEALTPTLP